MRLMHLSLDRTHVEGGKHSVHLTQQEQSGPSSWVFGERARLALQVLFKV